MSVQTAQAKGKMPHPAILEENREKHRQVWKITAKTAVKTENTRQVRAAKLPPSLKL